MIDNNEKGKLKSFGITSGIIAILLFISGWISEKSTEQKNDFHQIARAAEINLRAIETAALQNAKECLVLNSKERIFAFFSSKNFNRQGITILVYNNQELIAWSGSDVTFVSIDRLFSKEKKFIHLPNGWYEVLVEENANSKAVIFISVYSDYAYQNKYLVNEFNPALGIPDGVSIVEKDAKEFIRSRDGENLFGITEASYKTADETKFPFSETADVAAIILLLVCCVCLGRILLLRSSVLTLIFSLAIVAARLAMIKFHFPEPLYQTSLFSPQYYASSFLFGSTGDLFLNIAFILAIVLIFYRHEKIFQIYSLLKFSISNSVWHFAFWSFVIVSTSLAVNYYVAGIIINSKISFRLSNIFELSAFSALGFFIIAMLMGFYFLILRFAGDVIHHSQFATQYKTRYLIFATVVTLLLLFKNIFPTSDILASYTRVDLLVLIILSAITEILFIRKKVIPFPSAVLMLLIFSAYTSVLLATFNIRKEREALKVYAQKIEAEHDLVAEYLFEDIQNRLNNDSIVHRMFENKRADLISQRMQQVYFSGYLNRYNTRVLCYTNTGNLISIQLDSVPLNFYERVINVKGKNTLSENLFYTGNSQEKFSYIGRLFIGGEKKEDAKGIFIILFSEKFIQPGNGFPKLYGSGKESINTQYENFSFARYHDRKLISGYGNFSYPISSFVYEKKDGRFNFFSENGYEHLIYHPAQSSFVVISRKNFTLLDALTLFSYIITLFSFFFILISTSANVVNGNRNKSFSLKQRVRFSVMLVVLVSFVLTGWGTIQYITGKYDSEQDAGISKQINDILHAMENELPAERMLGNILSDEKTFLLTRLASNLASDFNLYDLNGKLIFSSQPKLYQQGIISDRMNPEALNELSVHGKTQFVQAESIGKLNYIAGYEPVRNRNNEIEGYIGLPYFEKQEELKKEISAFIGSLMNLYILLLAIALAAAYFISSRITKSLQHLKEKFGAIRLGSRNELIEWKHDDEVGALVSEYNRMVEELAVNAEMLARSEREGAWREMAKQVAHEIKNPLTPMKLSVQHLQRALHDNSPELPILTGKISQTLIEQIDALSSIATAFASFAKMPQAKKEKVNLNEIIFSVINLYKETSSVQVIFKIRNPSDSCFVMADKEELFRLFSNVIRNAIQSIPEGRDGRMEIKMEREIQRCIVSVTDNGSGIPSEIQPKIFSPNFTTKTTGMGLGLAMVKSIAESIGGKVWFETMENAGTTFYLEFPLYTESV
ncbi:MAG: GHKL domain-containing protein [Bacteroidia bacterium]|nr:GHKL domain-containing protein [Bacteroidia bacterium]